ncbi:MAG: esterase-like activity of phytase family protein [Bdellovibrionales bacterium]|nr:esterase-like activity of phytase family protein [Bdellovibrionales bacterium]
MEDQKRKRTPQHKPPSNIQKGIGLLIIAVSLVAGVYLMDRFQGVQVAWKPGEGKPSGLIQKDKDLHLEFIKDWMYPTGTKVGSYELGGISALAFVPESQQILALSDDRGRNGPPRFFIFEWKTQGQLDLVPKKAVPLKEKGGMNFSKRVVDPEGIASLGNEQFLWSSEGELELPPFHGPRWIRANFNGDFLGEIPIPKVFWDETKINFGIRPNLSFEALTVDPSKRWVYAMTESSLQQDGDVSDFENGTQLRIVELDHQGDSFDQTGEFVYDLSRIPTGNEPVAGLEVATIGASEILALGQRMFLIIERAYLARRDRNLVRLFFADCLQATDVQCMETLKGMKYTKCEKREILKFEDVEDKLRSGVTRVQNIEGMTWWRDLQLGKDYLLFVSDNNFNDKLVTQFLLFEMHGWKDPFANGK